MQVLQKMVAHAQYCQSGDNTLEVTHVEFYVRICVGTRVNVCLCLCECVSVLRVVCCVWWADT